MRKFVKTAVGDRENVPKAQRMAAKKQRLEGSSVAFAMAASMSGHHEATAEQYFNLNPQNPEDHVISSRAHIGKFVGPELRTPSAEHLKELRAQGRTAEATLDSFRSAVCNNGPVDESGISSSADLDSKNDLQGKATNS